MFGLRRSNVARLIAALAKHAWIASWKCHGEVFIPSCRMNSMTRYLRYLGQSDKVSWFRNEAKQSHWPTPCSLCWKDRLFAGYLRTLYHACHCRLRATSITLHDSMFCPGQSMESSANQMAPPAWAAQTCGSSGPPSNPTCRK